MPRPYYDTYQRLLGEEPKSVVSYVCHYMLFEKPRLDALKRAISERAGRAWAVAIYEAADKNNTSGCSEYETYGNFVTARSPGSFVRRHFNNRAVLDADLAEISDLVGRERRSGATDMKVHRTRSRQSARPRRGGATRH